MKRKIKNTNKNLLDEILKIENRYERIVAFIEKLLKHADGVFCGKPFILFDWEKEVLKNFYDTFDRDGNRKYETLFLEIPKKNGKSELAAAIALYHLIADDENAAEVYNCAVDKNQATIVFKASVNMIEQSPILDRILKITESTKKIIYRKNNIDNIYRVLSADVPSKHGLKPSCVIFDEIHAFPNREIYDILTKGSGFSRLNPVRMIITTAGNDADKKSIGWELHSKAEKIIKNSPEDTDWCCKIYNYIGNDIYNEDNWYKANPSLGKITTLKAFRKAANEAKESLTNEVKFRWLMLNQWVQEKAHSWINAAFYNKCISKINMDSLLGAECILGLDLSRAVDLSAIALYFPKQTDLDKSVVLYRIYIPEDSYKKRLKNNPNFYKWKESGEIQVIPGHYIDFDLIFEEIRELKLNYRIKSVCFDRMFANSSIQKVDKELELDCIEVPQTFMGLSEGMKRLEQKILAEEIVFEDNECARWCFSNVQVQLDTNNNIRPDKKHSLDSIDSTTALINAVAAEDGEVESIYDVRAKEDPDGKSNILTFLA